MKVNIMTISLYLNIFLCAESNIFTTKESHKWISDDQNAVTKPLRASYVNYNDESFVIRDNKNSDLSNMFVQVEHDNIGTKEKNGYKQSCNEKNSVKILKQLDNNLSQLLTSSDSFNFVKFLNESIFLIDHYLGTFEDEESIRSKIIQSTIKKSSFAF